MLPTCNTATTDVHDGTALVLCNYAAIVLLPQQGQGSHKARPIEGSVLLSVHDTAGVPQLGHFVSYCPQLGHFGSYCPKLGRFRSNCSCAIAGSYAFALSASAQHITLNHCNCAVNEIAKQSLRPRVLRCMTGKIRVTMLWGQQRAQ